MSRPNDFSTLALIEANVTKDDNGCWLWSGHLHKGYAREPERGRRIKIHRRVCELVHGELLPGLEPCHTCHVKCCVNPSHLVPGTHAVNMAMSGGRPRKKRQGQPHTDASRAKIRAARARQVITPEHRRAISESVKQYWARIRGVVE